jgi:hypothetical protein
MRLRRRDKLMEARSCNTEMQRLKINNLSLGSGVALFEFAPAFPSRTANYFSRFVSFVATVSSWIGMLEGDRSQAEFPFHYRRRTGARLWSAAAEPAEPPLSAGQLAGGRTPVHRCCKPARERPAGWRVGDLWRLSPRACSIRSKAPASTARMGNSACGLGYETVISD